MTNRLLPFVLGTITTLTLAATFRSAVDPQDPQDPQSDMAAMMAKAKEFVTPGPEHELLERFVGKWNTTTHFVMGGQKTPGEKGVAEYHWLMDGRWLAGKTEGTFMGNPAEGFSLLGYDRFKKSYVSTRVTSLDTAMNRTEGDMTRDGKALISFGTIDEYLTGEHDKTVKTIWRFVAEDKMVLEVHDLHIGETGTQVLEMVFERN